MALASTRDRAAARFATSPPGRGTAFLLDFIATLIRAARGNPRHPEERAEP